MSQTTSRLPEEACSLQSLNIAEPLAGTAPQATTWVFVEQPGPWGRKALVDSQLDVGVSQSLQNLDTHPDVKVLLTRHPSRPLRANTPDRYVWVSRSDGFTSELFQAHVSHVKDLESISFAEIAHGTLGTDFSLMQERFGFVCTHSGRDACCAVLGRGLIERSLVAMEGATPHQVWECSHIGGHRFAPTALLAPINTIVGRCDSNTINDWVATGHINTDMIRGSSWLDAYSQSTQAYILDQHRDLRPQDVHVHKIDDGKDSYRAIAVDGREWLVRVTISPLAADRPESCGGEAIPGEHILVTSCDQLI